MAKVKVINTSLDTNLNGTDFNNSASETIFSFGSFAVTSNFDGRTYINYNNKLSSFVRPVTLETMGVSESQSEILYVNATNAVLNLDKSDLNTFVRFGSAYEFLRISIQNIIINYPGSLYMNSQVVRGGNTTFFSGTTDLISNTSTFRIPMNCVVNAFGLITNIGNTTEPEGIILKNLNLSYDDYVVWSTLNPTGNSYNVIGFTGNTTTNNYLIIKTTGNPFSTITGNSGSIDFHIKPNNVIFEEFRLKLSDYEKYIISERDDTNGFKFILKNPTLLDNGTITYSNTLMLWTTGDKYNIDFNTPSYRNFLEIVLTIGTKCDTIKTDLIARFLTPSSLKTYDLTDEGKMTKLLRIYGREFDQMRQFVDSLVYINKVTYDKINNIPDQLIKNLSRTFGWDYFSLVNEDELVNNFLTIDDSERNLKTDLLPAEIDIELWRRILNNTNYFWKSKGTRHAIKSMFLLIGIPEPFINITEYVYTVNGKIDPRNVTLSISDFPSNSLPYDSEGYPVAPLETNDFYFQLSGDTDGGQAYLDVFRKVGFNLMQTVDNKKSWIQTGSTTRIHNTTPQYYQEDSKLVINTKEIDVALDISRGIEYDVYRYIKEVDFPANSGDFTLPFSYVNISLGYTGNENTFTLPSQYNKAEGDLEVRFNGILLNAPKEYSGGTNTYEEITEADYIISGNSFILTNSNYAIKSGSRRDVVEATYVYSGSSNPITGVTVKYMVTRIKPNIIGTAIPLPSYPNGDVQVTINGIALTKGSSQYNADYIVDPNNTTGSSQIIIQNSEIISYLATNPFIQVAYITVTGSTSIAARSEILRIDSFNTGKLYYNNSANKYVYKLNYKVNNASEVKMLIDGISLEPLMDYDVNTNNKYEIFLPTGLKYGSVISAYYIVGGNDYFNPVVADYFGVGDISNLSFLEFLELIQRKLINARNRKTITDFKGGWYPTLLKIYVDYLKRANLSPQDPLLSNGYTFENLYSFLSKYNAFFHRFVDQLLSATIILKKGGLLIRNNIFSKQKYAYKRGTNVSSNGRILLEYLGDDGSVFVIDQNILPPPTPPPTISLYVDTITGATGIGQIINSGGKNITNYNILTEYGMQYRTGTTWSEISYSGALGVNNFTIPTITGLSENTLYEYRAFVKSNIHGYTGNTLQITTQSTPIIPSISTKIGTSGIYSINNTGGNNIVGYSLIDYYAMQYRVSGSTTWLLSPSVPLSGPLGVNNYTITISGLTGNTNYQYRAYMLIDGIPYYGLISGITTQNVITYTPSASTGNAGIAGTTSFDVTGNTVTSNGGLTINEYGVLYSQNVSYGTISTLIYGNIPPVGIISTGSTINVGYPYTATITGLTDNTMTYYRAFAKNTKPTDCIGYGSIKCIQTAEPPMLPIVNTSGVLGRTISSIDVVSSLVCQGNPSTISEYGVFYADSPDNLTCDNYPALINKVSCCASLLESSSFMMCIQGLYEDTTTYFRPFAINPTGIGYGSIDNEKTFKSYEVGICRAYCGGLPFDASGFICIDPALIDDHTVNAHIMVYQSVTNPGSQSIGCVEFFIKPNTCPSYESIGVFLCTESTDFGVTVNCQTSSPIPITIGIGDCVCYNNSISGDFGSYSNICLEVVESSTSSPYMNSDPAKQCDCVVI